MKKLLSVIIVLTMIVAVFAGCTNNSSKPSGAQTLSVCIGPKTETIDPTLNSTSDGGSMLLHSFEALLTHDNTGKLQPGQAAEMPKISEDGLVYTFTLRDGLKWSNGDALTAEDFEYTLKRLADPEVAAPYGELISMIAGFDEAHKSGGNLDALQVVAKDEKTLEITLSAPTQYFNEIMAFPATSPVNKKTIEENGDQWALKAESYISNGAFYVAEYKDAEYILMKKNPNYWNTKNIKLDEIKFELIEDANTIYSGYQSGRLSLVKDIPTNEIARLKADKNPEFHLDPMQGTYYVSLKVKDHEFFSNTKVRKALSLAIDRDRIANEVMEGTYTPASTFVPAGVSDPSGKSFMDTAIERNGGKGFYNIDGSTYEADLEEAKKLMKEAGYENGFKVSYIFNEASYHKPVAEALQSMWKEIGVEVEVSAQEWNSFVTRRREGDFDVARNGWISDYDDPTSFLDLLITDNGNNDAYYSNPAYDALMKKAAEAATVEERFEFLHQAEELAVRDDAAVIPLAYYNEFYMIKDNVKGFYHTPLGYFVFLETYIG